MTTVKKLVSPKLVYCYCSVSGCLFEVSFTATLNWRHLLPL